LNNLRFAAPDDVSGIANSVADDEAEGAHCRQYAVERRPGDIPAGSKDARLAATAPAWLAVGATVLWVMAIRGIDLRRMSDVGLVSVLPPLACLALAMLTAGYCLALRQRPLHTLTLFLHLGALIFMLAGITALVEPVPRLGVAWLHAGFIEYITRTGTIAPTLDARFSWPGFFIFGALLTQVAGLPSATSLLGWAPVAFNLLYLGPLLITFRAMTSDRRLVWLGIWFFYLADWIGQDYFSPQALTFFLYLVILSVLLRWFREPVAGPPVWLGRLGGLSSARALARVAAWLTRSGTPSFSSRPGQRAGLMALVLILFAAIASSHQLTPFALLAGVSALVLFNRCSARGLPVVMAILIGAWTSYMAISYLQGHLTGILGEVGQVGTSVGANVTDHLQGSPGHVFVVRLRVVVTLALWGTAVLGGVRRLCNGYRDLAAALLASASFLLLGLQSYGGEMLLRVYLFALPFTAFFAAALFYTTPGAGTTRRTTVAIGLVSVLLLGSFFFTRYGNEQFESFTAGEVDAVQYLYRTAPPGSLLLAAAPNLPWRFQDVEKYDYQSLPVRTVIGPDIETIAGLMANEKYPGAYLILTRSEEAFAAADSGLPPAAWERFEETLTASGRFRLAFTAEDAMIFTLNPGRTEASP
jgi:hypothetical protein